MKIVALIPYWKNYTYQDSSLVSRDLICLSGKPLLNYPVVLANRTKLITNTYIFTNDMSVENVIQCNLNFSILPRPEILDSQHATIENIIESFLNIVECDYVVLLHPNAPFVKPETLSDCIEKVINAGFDSSFLAKSEQKFAWYKNQRLNYSVVKGTPHLLEVDPIIIESSAAYVFARETFIKFGTRIGDAHYAKIIGSFEGMIITSREDLKIAEFLSDTIFLP